MSVDHIDLFGWDTVFGISYTKANEAIKSLKSTPPTFNYKDQDKKGNQRGTVDGTWGDWQLTTKGDGQNVTLECPIVKGTFTTITESGTTFDLTGTWVEIEVKLQYLDQHNPTYIDPTAKEGTGDQKNLLIKTTSSDPKDPVVSIEASSFNFPDASDPEVAEAICSSYFKNWFNKNLSQFNHVFSILVVNQIADKDQFKWLKPTDVGYAVSSTENPETSVFAVLAMTEGRFKGQNAHMVDPRLLTVAGGTHSAFAISAPLFVQKWLMPGLLQMRLGSTADDYVLSSDGLSWQNKKDIQWATFTDKKGKSVPANISNGKFLLGVVGDTIKLDFQDLYWEATSGVTMHVNYTEFYNLLLKSGTDIEGTPYSNVLTVENNGNPYLTVSTDIASWKKWTELGFEIGMAVLGAIVGGLVGGAFDAATEGVGAAAARGAAVADKEGLEMVTMNLSKTVTNVISKSSESIEQISASTAKEAGSEIEAASSMAKGGASSSSILAKFVSKTQDIGKSMWKTRWKLVGGMIGGALGSGIGLIPKIVDDASEEKFSKLPSLEEFGRNCVETVHWPGTGGFNLTSASLVGALVLGGDLQEMKGSKDKSLEGLEI